MRLGDNAQRCGSIVGSSVSFSLRHFGHLYRNSILNSPKLYSLTYLFGNYDRIDLIFSAI